MRNKSSSYPDPPPRNLEPDYSHEVLLEFLPPRPIQVIAEFAVIVHLTPAISPPFTACHVDYEITPLLVVMDVCIIAIL